MKTIFHFIMKQRQPSVRVLIKNLLMWCRAVVVITTVAQTLLTILRAGNKSERYSSVSHTTKTIHHHHHYWNMEQINRRTPFPKNASGWVLLYEWKFIVMTDSSSQYKAFWGLDLFSEHNSTWFAEWLVPLLIRLDLTD